MASQEFLIGKRERMAWGEESTFKGGATLEEIVGINVSIEPNENQNFQEVLTAGADTRAVEDRIKGPLSLPFTMRFAPVNWRWLKYLMDVSDSGTSPTTHTFTIGNTLNTFELEWAKRHTTNHVLTFQGCFMKSATISWTKPTGPGREGLIEVAAECQGTQAPTQGTSVTSLSNISKDPFQYRHSKFTLDGSEIQEVNNGEMTIDTGVDPNDSRYANATLDRELADPIPKVFRVSGRINVNVADKTYYDLWATADSVSGTTKMEFIRGTNDDIVFDFSNFRIEAAIANTNLEGTTNVDIIFTADGFSSVTATDDISSY